MIDKPRTNWELRSCFVTQMCDGASDKMKFGDYPEILEKIDWKPGYVMSFISRNNLNFL